MLMDVLPMAKNSIFRSLQIGYRRKIPLPFAESPQGGMADRQA
jgi:hypothetical protein